MCESIPDDNHVLVNLLQLLLGDIEGVGWGVELVSLEALIAEGDLERLIFGLSVDKQTFVSNEDEDDDDDDKTVYIKKLTSPIDDIHVRKCRWAPENTS